MSSNLRNEQQETGKILIVGGYGEVGLSIAERLAPRFPRRVVIAGRNPDKAKAAAAEVGHGAEGRALDIFEADSGRALDGVALTVVCLDQTKTRFVEQCLSRGIHYLDISADYTFLSQVEKVDDLARRNGVTALLSVGTAPGLTNLLAARTRDKMDSVDRIDILLEFGLGDHHGRAAVEWMFDNLDASYQVMENGCATPVRSFGDSLGLALAGQDKKRPAYRFNFSDQHVLGRTLNGPSVSTWVRFDDRFSTWLFAVSSRAGLGRLLRRPLWRKLAVWLFMNVHMGSDICGVSVRAIGRTGAASAETVVGVTGRKEPLMTAIIAAESVRQMLTESLGPGVLHSDQAIEIDPVVAALRAEYPDLVVAI
ncbi:MAG: hypothetical protein CMI60_08620 [Parvibaculum sp.]|nr:hypothetical protein [Parvibaculum sp.]|tara:strand:+ start:5340 stop:6440 length:1101 start_codon:yes stop_codon:yes gene_type:complete